MRFHNLYTPSNSRFHQKFNQSFKIAHVVEMGIMIMLHDHKVIIIVIIYRLVMLPPQTPFFIIYNLIDSTHSISHFYLHWVNSVKRCGVHTREKEFLMHVMDMSQNEIDTFFVYIRYFASFCISLSIRHRTYNFDLSFYSMVFTQDRV